MVKRNFSILVFLCFLSFYCLGQNVNSSLNNAYVPSGAFISFFGNHTFSNGINNSKVIYTNKGSNPGSVNFVNNAKWIGANDNSYVDGYVKVYHNNFFTFPIGDMGFYKPISITGATGTSAAYFFEDVRMNHVFIQQTESRANSKNESTVDIIPSLNEYWIVKGDEPTQIVMHWNEDSDLKSFVNSIDELKLIGWNGSSWEEIDAEILEYALNTDNSTKSFSNNKSNLKSGSLVSSTLIPNDYSIITFGSSKGIDSATVSETINQLSAQGNIDLTIFPNPINNLNNVKLDYSFDKNEGDAHVMIYDNLGKLIYKQKLEENEGIFRIPLDMPVDQIYNIGIITNKGSKRFGPVIVTGF